MYTGCSVLNKSNINNSSTRLADGAIVDGWNARYGISTTTDCLLMGNVGWYGRCGKWKMLTFSNEGGIFPCGFKCCRCWHFSLSRLYWRFSLFPISVLYLKKILTEAKAEFVYENRKLNLIAVLAKFSKFRLIQLAFAFLFCWEVVLCLQWHSHDINYIQLF